MTNAFGFQVDSGTFAETLDQALARADVAGFAARRRQSEARGRLRGLGFAYHIKGTGGSPEENVDIRFEADGTVSLITGTQHIGQGHETTFPQILAHRLGVPNERIRLRQGDTDLIATGGGHGSSRATYMGGTAMWRASDEIIAKGTALAADALEAAEADIRFEDGRFVVSGTDRAIGLLEVAALGREKGKPLDTYHFWKREHMTFPNGTHVVEVEIDRDTGRVEPRALHRGRRLRRAGQSDDRRGPGAWRDGPGRRPGAARARDLRSGVRPDGRRLVHGLCPAARRRPAVVRSRLQRHALHDQSAGREGLRRGRRDRGLSRHRQCDPRCAGAARRQGFRRTGHPGAHLAGDAGGTMKRHAPATARNRQPILDVLRPRLPADGLVLEVASGSGEHIVHFAEALPDLVFQPSDPNADARASIDDWAGAAVSANVRPALALDAASQAWPIERADAVLCCNMIHIAPWEATVGLIAGAARLLPADGPLYLYGPYRRDGRHTAPSNEAFDRDLRQRNPAWGVRDLEAVTALAAANGFAARRSSTCRPTICRWSSGVPDGAATIRS